MLLGIDHLVIAVRDPDVAVTTLAGALGLQPGGGGRHPTLGTRNRLIWLGDSYLELIGVVDRGLATGSWIGAPTVRALDAGGGLATWAVATDAIDAEVARLRVLGADLDAPRAGERTRPDGSIVRWRLAVPPRLSPSESPFLIEHDLTAAEWTAPEREARAGHPVRLLGIDLTVDDPTATADGYRRTLGVVPRDAAGEQSTLEVRLGDQVVRLGPRTDGSPPTAIRIAIPGGRPTETDALGCRWVVTA